MFRAFFIALSESKSFRRIAEHSSFGKRVSKRFVSGMQPQDALDAARVQNELGIRVTVDNLGENVTNLEEAKESAALYHELLDKIAEQKLDANVSLKLTHMGYDVDVATCEELVRGLLAHAVRTNCFVRIDMEGSPYTQKTLDFVHKLHAEPGHAGRVGAVIQSYHLRSEADVRELCAKGIRIRLCKGAYKEPASIAFQAKKDVDANFMNLTKIMLKSGVFHGIATHDETMINQTIAFAKTENIPASAFEFQMLHGIRADLQKKLVKDGWGMRVYIPFGTEWYPYYMRRLAERPANVLFIAKNFFRG
jgi:proline dehydrogenase